MLLRLLILSALIIPGTVLYAAPRCSDGRDNDRDGLVDYPAEPGCAGVPADSEAARAALQDPGSPGFPALGVGASLNGARLFPDDNPWNQDISGMPVDPRSAKIIKTLGGKLPLHPDFGTVWKGAPNGIPYVVVSGSQAKLKTRFGYWQESDHELYPIPDNPPIQGGSRSRGDRHIIMIDRDNWRLYELYNAWPKRRGWWAGSGAIFDLNSNALRPAGWTSADAAGLPIFPGLVRYDEVYEQGEIRHALRFTVRHTRRAYVYPARHFASWLTSPNLPPMGARFRLKADFDISPFPYAVQVILRALKKYGMFVADNGGDWFISGAPDPRWSDRELSQIKGVHAHDLELVQMGEIVTD